MKHRLSLQDTRAVIAVTVGALSMVVALAPPAAGGPATLRATIEDVARRWPDIGHITPAELDRLIAARAAVVFDVRTFAEYAVSHLPGAISVDPDMTAAAFLSRYGGAVKGKATVFYCSVGVRSSRLAERVAQGLKARGATAVHDLAGGIFAWHGKGRVLVDAEGPTGFVHPYDASWGRLLARPELARTAPRLAPHAER
jgi:rhodanese-related sulfurtransferase